MAEGDFKAALTRLASEPDYRQRAIEDPEIIQRDFSLDIRELQALRQAAVMSGADVRAVDSLRGRQIAEGTARMRDDVSVSCCSCCCCCCGETAVSAS